MLKNLTKNIFKSVIENVTNVLYNFIKGSFKNLFNNAEIDYYDKYVAKSEDKIKKWNKEKF